MLVAERVVEAAEILAAPGDGDARLARRLGGQIVEMGQAPSTRGEESCVTPAHRAGVSRAPSGPDCKNKWPAGPALLLFAEVVAMRIRTGRRELKRRIADHEDRFMRQRSKSLQVWGLGARLGEFGADLPDFPAQQLQQRH